MCLKPDQTVSRRRVRREALAYAYGTLGNAHSAHVKDHLQKYTFRLLLDAEYCTIIWHRIDNMRKKTRGEMLKLAVVEVSDRGSGVLRIRRLEELPLSKLVDRDIESGAKHIRCAKLSCGLVWSRNAGLIAEHTMIAVITKSVPITAARR